MCSFSVKLVHFLLKYSDIKIRRATKTKTNAKMQTVSTFAAGLSWVSVSFYPFKAKAKMFGKVKT